ncbi:MAG TPA: ABC transporter ATP-binding protein [Bacillota bacterium]
MIKVERLEKSFGPLRVLDGLSLEFPEGKITALLGPSGCGKTTLLNIIAGLGHPDAGAVHCPEMISYLFQEPRLIPWLTVRGNIALVLEDKMPQEAAVREVSYYLSATGLEAYAEFYPSQLSGGLRQRVAMARAFAYQAPLLLMDEPFKSLDLRTRFRMLKDFIMLWQARPRTVITVTHDLKEGLWLGDQVILLTDKPARVARRVMLDIPREERLGDHRVLTLENELTELILESI